MHARDERVVPRRRAVFLNGICWLAPARSCPESQLVESPPQVMSFLWLPQGELFPDPVCPGRWQHRLYAVEPSVVHDESLLALRARLAFVCRKRIARTLCDAFLCGGRAQLVARIQLNQLDPDKV